MNEDILDLALCWVEKHCFIVGVERQYSIDTSPMIGQCTGGTVQTIAALVEFEDGTCDLIDPIMIRFVDSSRIESMFHQYKEEYKHD